ncbi:helix-turn-helix domain-containing protein [Oricola sp.]|uniref:helix-turn-helix domain-containing protein n=1 Tax=Oricola sp. TaxID=1979950 RepID=UPI003BAA2528
MDAQTLPLVMLLEIAVRGGSASIGLLMAVLLLAVRPVREVTVFGALFFFGAASYAITAFDPVYDMLGGWKVPITLYGTLTPGFFWLFVLAMFDDRFRMRPWMAAPLAAIAALFLVCIPFPVLSPFAKSLQFALAIGLMGHVLILARRSLGDDLVASRRRFSGIIAALLPVVCLTIGVIEVYELMELRDHMGTHLISGLLFAVSVGTAFAVAGVRKSLLPEAPRREPAPVSAHPAADRFDLARLEKLMADGVFLDQGLTIGELAKRMNMPEHRLRRLINRELGYRNFAAFINDHRIEEAKRRLSEPDTAREQITSLAFDLGYASLAPFNRAFRERIGMSPSQYREKALSAN